MIKVEFGRFFTDRIWFGWWYRNIQIDDSPSIFGWVRDPNPDLHWKIKRTEWLTYKVNRC